MKAGDTLSKIAEGMLGDADRWPEISEANKDVIKDPNVIQPGIKLTIPDSGAKPKAPKHDFE